MGLLREDDSQISRQGARGKGLGQGHKCNHLFLLSLLDILDISFFSSSSSYRGSHEYIYGCGVGAKGGTPGGGCLHPEAHTHAHARAHIHTYLIIRVTRGPGDAQPLGLWGIRSLATVRVSVLSRNAKQGRD